MNPVQYIIANQGARMSPGKLAAQVAHASVKGVTYDILVGTALYLEWNDSGHTKIVLAARDNDHMLWAERYLSEQGFHGQMIIDEGRTEVSPLTPTALGFPILDKDDEKVKFAFSTFKLYKDLPPEIIITPPNFGIPEATKRFKLPWRNDDD
jgi:PTH2 family peptidyl-tRNA hydrolase